MAATLEIGRNSAGAGEELNGYLDSFRIIKGRALTPEEIKAAASRRPYAVYTSPVLDATVQHFMEYGQLDRRRGAHRQWRTAIQYQLACRPVGF